MKKPIALVVVLFSVLLFSSCAQQTAKQPPVPSSSPEVSASVSPRPLSSPSASPSPSPSPSPSSSPEYYDVGQYKVGIDIPAGEYCLGAGDSGGYFCVSSDSNGDDILDNENFDNQYFITIEDGQYIELSYAVAVPVGDGKLDRDPSRLDEGMYRVGIDIPVGEYSLTAESSGGYVCIYDNSTVDKDILSNDNFDNNKYVTVSDGQYLYLSRCSASLID